MQKYKVLWIINGYKYDKTLRYDFDKVARSPDLNSAKKQPGMCDKALMLNVVLIASRKYFILSIFDNHLTYNASVTLLLDCYKNL